MVKIKYLLCAALLVLILMAGCSATSSSTGEENPTTYVKKVGKATAKDFKRKTEKVLTRRFYYQIVRHESNSDQIYYETNWKYRNPFEDEQSLGIGEARTMIIVEARPRVRFRGEEPWVVTMTCNNEVRLQNNQEWVRIPMTNETLKYFRDIITELKMEYDMGVRTY